MKRFFIPCLAIIIFATIPLFLGGCSSKQPVINCTHDIICDHEMNCTHDVICDHEINIECDHDIICDHDFICEHEPCTHDIICDHDFICEHEIPVCNLDHNPLCTLTHCDGDHTTNPDDQIAWNNARMIVFVFLSDIREVTLVSSEVVYYDDITPVEYTEWNANKPLFNYANGERVASYFGTTSIFGGQIGQLRYFTDGNGNYYKGIFQTTFDFLQVRQLSDGSWEIKNGQFYIRLYDITPTINYV